MRIDNRRLTNYTLLIGFFLIPFMMGNYRIIGYAGLGFILLGVFSNTKKISLSKISLWALLSVLLIGIRLLAQMITNNTYDSTIRSAVLQISTYIFVIGICNCRLCLDDWKWILDKSAVFYLVIGAYLFFRGQLEFSNLFGTMYGNVLIVTFGVFLNGVFLDDRKIIRISECIVAFVFLFFTNMRSASVGAAIGVVYVLLPHKVTENRKFNRTIFIALVIMCFLVPYIYMELYRPTTAITSSISNYIQISSRQLTGNRFFSGRHIIWPNVLQSINEAPLLGKGIGFNPSEIYDTSQSTHNLFLFIRLEQGFVGLFVFVMLIKKVWDDYNNLLTGSIKISTQAIFVSLMIQQTFSLGLLGGKGAFSFFSWAVLIAYTRIASDSESIEMSMRD